MVYNPPPPPFFIWEGKHTLKLTKLFILLWLIPLISFPLVKIITLAVIWILQRYNWITIMIQLRGVDIVDFTRRGYIVKVG